MRKRLLGLWLPLLLIVAVGATSTASAAAKSRYRPQPDSSVLLTQEELEELVAPIALYPDPLIAQMLPAATYVDDLEEAARYVEQFGSTARVDDQPWDVSVRAVAHYPEALFMMDREHDWTAALGQAFVNQQQDVMEAIQRLRRLARAEGNLVSTREQQVVEEAGIIMIVPAQPQYLYIPRYDPEVVYVERYEPGIISFGFGFVIGTWLNRDCDWHRHRVYYHGWRNQHGWVHRSRPYVHMRSTPYMGRNAGTINVDPRVFRRNTRAYREKLREDALNRPRGGRVTPGTREHLTPGTREHLTPGTREHLTPGTREHLTPGVQHPAPLPRGRNRPQLRPDGHDLNRNIDRPSGGRHGRHGKDVHNAAPAAGVVTTPAPTRVSPRTGTVLPRLAPSPTMVTPAPTRIAPAPTTVAPAPTRVAPSPTTVAPATRVAPSPTTVSPSPRTTAPSPTTVTPHTTTMSPAPVSPGAGAVMHGGPMRHGR